KRKRLQTGGVLDSSQAEALLAKKSGGTQIRRLEVEGGGHSEGRSTRQRRCRKCGKTGHNSRTC
ncbi:hypothetical protein K458DRAFT_261280, partial [Lentithecium fluviatile CBS 122367]